MGTCGSREMEFFGGRGGVAMYWLLLNRPVFYIKNYINRFKFHSCSAPPPQSTGILIILFRTPWGGTLIPVMELLSCGRVFLVSDWRQLAQDRRAWNSRSWIAWGAACSSISSRANVFFLNFSKLCFWIAVNWLQELFNSHQLAPESYFVQLATLFGSSMKVFSLGHWRQTTHRIWDLGCSSLTSRTL